MVTSSSTAFKSEESFSILIKYYEKPFFPWTIIWTPLKNIFVQLLTFVPPLMRLLISLTSQGEIYHNLNAKQQQNRFFFVFTHEGTEQMLQCHLEGPKVFNWANSNRVFFLMGPSETYGDVTKTVNSLRN